MKYYLDIFSPETFESFGKTDRKVTGFRERHRARADRVQIGDRLICYMTKLSRWVGVLEVKSRAYVDASSLLYQDNDPYVVRFDVEPLVWLPRDKTIPIHDPSIWDRLSFTRGVSRGSTVWTGKVRTSLNLIADEDGKVLEASLSKQRDSGGLFPIAEEVFQRLVARPLRRDDRIVTVTVPQDDEGDEGQETADRPRESSQVQALLARCGEIMGFRVWLPKSDRSAVFREWQPAETTMLQHLPLNYDETTLKTIEQIDVLWLKGRSIVRAFEVEHTTAIYSGILRMADLLALQPNMDIKLHIVAPQTRKEGFRRNPSSRLLLAGTWSPRGMLHLPFV